MKNIPEILSKEISDLWHISKSALVNSVDVSRHSRMLYIKQELTTRTEYKYLIQGISPKKLWFIIEENTLPYKSI